VAYVSSVGSLNPALVRVVRAPWDGREEPLASALQRAQACFSGRVAGVSIALPTARYLIQPRVPAPGVGEEGEVGGASAPSRERLRWIRQRAGSVVVAAGLREGDLEGCVDVARAFRGELIGVLPGIAALHAVIRPALVGAPEAPVVVAHSDLGVTDLGIFIGGEAVDVCSLLCPQDAQARWRELVACIGASLRSAGVSSEERALRIVASGLLELSRPELGFSPRALPPSVEPLRRYSPFLAALAPPVRIAAALALHAASASRGPTAAGPLNFFAPELRARANVAAKVQGGARASAAIVALSALGSLVLGGAASALHEETKALGLLVAEAARASANRAVANEQEDARQAASRSEEVVTKRYPDASRLVAMVSESTPPGVVLSQIEIDGDAIVVEGRAVEAEGAAVLRSLLARALPDSAVRLERATVVSGGATEFSVRAGKRDEERGRRDGPR